MLIKYDWSMGMIKMRDLWAHSPACEETDRQASFGAFFQGDMIGMCSAEKWSDDLTGKTVKWGSAYVEPAFSKGGIYKDLCYMRKSWSREKGFDKAVFAIRADNRRSREVNEKHGAKIIREDIMQYADQSVAARCWFEKDLREID